MYSAIILAGGKSSRLKDDIPKQFSKLNNHQSVLDFSVNVFLNNNKIDEVIIVVPKNWKSKITKKYTNCKVILGGETRSESSYLGLQECSSKCQNVLIHDAARPFVSQKIINDCMDKLQYFDAVVPILDSYDSLLDISNKNTQYLERDMIKFVQTPQGFNYKRLLNAYENYSVGTDDLSALLGHNQNIKKTYIVGNKINFKITDQADLEIARKIAYEL